MAKDLTGAIEAMEDEYRSKLIAALERCASGQWGLFATNKDSDQYHRTPAAEAAALIELGQDICSMRERAGLDPFALHYRFLSERGRRSNPNELGEPKRALAWLEQLQAE